jgi:hypothetical protein
MAFTIMSFVFARKRDCLLTTGLSFDGLDGLQRQTKACAERADALGDGCEHVGCPLCDWMAA